MKPRSAHCRVIVVGLGLDIATPLAGRGLAVALVGLELLPAVLTAGGEQATLLVMGSGVAIGQLTNLSNRSGRSLLEILLIADAADQSSVSAFDSAAGAGAGDTDRKARVELPWAGVSGRGVRVRRVRRGNPDELTRVIVAAVERLLQRRQHREVVSALDATMASAPRAAPPEPLLDRFVDQLPFGCALLDEQGVVLTWNRRAEQVTGVAEAALRGRALALRAPFETLAPLVAALQAGRGEAGLGALASTVVLPAALDVAGQPRHLRATMAPVLLPDRPQRLLLLLEDVTAGVGLEQEQERLRRQVSELEELEGLATLVGGIAHDFNNLLQVILSSVDAAETCFRSGAESAEALAHARVATTQAASLIEQLVTAAGRSQLRREEVDVAILVEETCRQCSRTAPEGVEFRLDIPARLPLVEGDFSQLRRVVQSLIENAIEALPAGGGLVSLSAREEGRENGVENRPDPWLVLEVADDGRGMDARQSRRAFDPFFTTKFLGRGLGLAVARGAVRSHGGSITLESATGQGSRVRVAIPALRSRKP